MPTVNIHDAKTQFSRLIERVGAGEEIIIAKSGKPVARLVRFHERAARRKLGLMAGQFSVPDDFDSIGAGDIERLFAGAGA
jgi:prevent-host-death family protein